MATNKGDNHARHRVVWIIGAGASAAIDQRVPVMSNFFEKAITKLDYENRRFWVAFAVAEEARAFPPNPDAENCGIRIGVLGRLLSRLKANSTQPSGGITEIEEELKSTVSQYKAEFEKDASRRSANLEEVFSKAERYRYEYPAFANVFDRFQFVIHGLLKQLDEELSAEFREAAHHRRSDLVASHGEFEHTFISFNYDLWLEKALFGKGLWLPRDGHGSYHFEYYSRPVEDVTPEMGRVLLRNIPEFPIAGRFGDVSRKSKVKILKPHGSLSWMFSGDGDKDGLVILESDEDSCVGYDRWWFFPMARFADNRISDTMFPLIVPPIPTKIRAHPVFWKTDKDIVEALSRAEDVVVIGWSMPETDQYFRELISSALSNRREQIRKLILCDKDQGPYFYAGFEAVFRPIQMAIWDRGFDRHFVDWTRRRGTLFKSFKNQGSGRLQRLCDLRS